MACCGLPEVALQPDTLHKVDVLIPVEKLRMTHLLGVVPRIITNLSENEKELVIDFLQLLTPKYEIGYHHWHS